ncbi:hypothetical protein NP493_54g04048 [Ridgeia piscesae]|uniref:AMP-dependent synthetase/ligase domain-containing protein n=1 Tax=Ridgeia piscesae TaxID=27915 RepID=A0AAD9PAX1_RIDPI|nr:hypothetical protein NP493_54g04048 [Ridgeia piscesae]
MGESPGCESLATLTKTGYLLPAADNDDRHLEVNPSTDTAIILFSSGTTGLSKGVQLTHYNFVAVMLIISQPALCTHTTDHMVVFQPLSHVFGLHIVIEALSLGRTVHLLPRFQFDVYLDVVSKFKVITPCQS